MTAAPKIAAEHLGDPGVDGVARRDLLGQQHPERDRRVDVAAADRPDDVGHDQQGEAEREGDAEDADVVGGEDRAARSAHARARRCRRTRRRRSARSCATTPRVSAMPGADGRVAGRRAVRGSAMPSRRRRLHRRGLYCRGAAVTAEDGAGAAVSVDRRGAHADRAADRHPGHRRRRDAPARRADRRGADDDPARRHRRVDDDAHARPRLRAGRRVLLHRGPARRRAGDRRALLRQRLGRRRRAFNDVTVETGGRAPAPTPRLGTTSSSCGWCGSDQIDALLERLAPLPPSDADRRRRARRGARPRARRPGPVRDDRRRPRRGRVRRATARCC